jgi:hypothetical protein
VMILRITSGSSGHRYGGMAFAWCGWQTAPPPALAAQPHRWTD